MTTSPQSVSEQITVSIADPVRENSPLLHTLIEPTEVVAGVVTHGLIVFSNVTPLYSTESCAGPDPPAGGYQSAIQEISARFVI